MTAARSGEAVALNQLIGAHRQGVYRYGLRVCRTTEDAEDAVQEVLWAATRALHSFRGSASSVVSWMFTMVRRECFRLLDRRHRSPVGLIGSEDQLSGNSCDPWDVLAERERTDLLVAALGELAPIHREVILLRDIQEISAPRAAAQLGISVDALKSRLHRARVNLRERVLSLSDVR